MNRIDNQPTVAHNLSTKGPSSEISAKKNFHFVNAIKNSLPTRTSPTLTQTIFRAAKAELPLMVLIGTLSPLLSIAYDKLSNPSNPSPTSDPDSHHFTRSSSSHHPRTDSAAEKSTHSPAQKESIVPSSAIETAPSSDETNTLFSDIGFGAS